MLDLNTLKEKEHFEVREKDKIKFGYDNKTNTLWINRTDIDIVWSDGSINQILWKSTQWDKDSTVK